MPLFKLDGVFRVDRVPTEMIQPCEKVSKAVSEYLRQDLLSDYILVTNFRADQGNLILLALISPEL